MGEYGIFIDGKRGNIGTDLAEVASLEKIELCEQVEDADFVALCVPSHVAEEKLASDIYDQKTVIDFSGAAKRKRIGQYGLMLGSSRSWDEQFDVTSRVFGNPGCIASAVLLGLRRSRTLEWTPEEVSVFAVGGKSYVHDIDDNEIRLANRLIAHPHVTEINTALPESTRVTSFMPTVTSGVERGLLVGVSGRLRSGRLDQLNFGASNVSVRDVAGSDQIQHRLEVQTDGHFSLAVVIDNLRFVTRNALNLMQFVHENRQ